MVYKNVHIPLKIIRSEKVGPDSKSVYFERPVGFTYEAGDWIDIDFADTSIKGGRVYSLSSSPTESELAITFREGITPFKRRLQSAMPDENMFISQYGNDYNFYIKENRSSVLIAGGIGIAPFRSMIKEIFDNKIQDNVQLLYMNKGDAYIFANEINSWNKELPNLEVIYINTKELNRKKREKLLLSKYSRSAHYYFIAGPENMVESTEHLLIDDGIDVKSIRIDSFDGY